jgi:hypothetical protein
MVLCMKNCFKQKVVEFLFRTKVMPVKNGKVLVIFQCFVGKFSVKRYESGGKLKFEVCW